MNEPQSVPRQLAQTLEVIYTWPDGRKEVRYRRPARSTAADELIAEVNEQKARHGADCPYSYRFTLLGDNPPPSEEKESK